MRVTPALFSARSAARSPAPAKPESPGDESLVPMILDADSGDHLAAGVREVLSWDPANRVTADLSLIGAKAVEVSPASLRHLAELQQARLYEDQVVEVPQAPDSDITPEMNASAPTIGAPVLWRRGIKGQGTTIAVIDTGITPHKDFGDRLVAFHDVINNRSQPYDDHSHGTHVAGIAAGDGSDSNGRYSGIAPEAELVGIKAFDNEGRSRVSNVIKAIQWAVANKDRHGIDIINLSARTIAKNSYRSDPLARAVSAAADRGILPVVAVGNDGPGEGTIGSPAHAPKALSVGAVNDRGTARRSDDRMYRGSARGPTPVDGISKPDVVAPGVNIRAPRNRSKGYMTKTGTSMAAPAVSGLAALLLSAAPRASQSQLKSVIVGSAESMGRLGDRHDQGSGLVDGPAALARLRSLDSEPGPEA